MSLFPVTPVPSEPTKFEPRHNLEYILSLRVDRGLTLKEIAAEISMSRRRVEQLLGKARRLSEAGPFANLPDFHREHLLSLGLTTLDDVERSLCAGHLQAPKVFGPSRIRDVELWLQRERAKERG